VDGKYSNLVKDDPSAAGTSCIKHNAVSAFHASANVVQQCQYRAPASGAASNACLASCVTAVTLSVFDAFVHFTHF
jgi:hypothetical protein